MTMPDHGDADETPPFAAHDTLGYALKRAQHAMRQHMDRQLKEIGLSAPQYNVLASLELEPGASNAALSRRAFVTPQTMQAMLVKLERAGLIAREPDAGHGRIQRTELTAKGRKAVGEAHRRVEMSERLAQDAAGPEATAILTRVADALG